MAPKGSKQVTTSQIKKEVDQFYAEFNEFYQSEFRDALKRIKALEKQLKKSDKASSKTAKADQAKKDTQDKKRKLEVVASSSNQVASPKKAKLEPAPSTTAKNGQISEPSSPSIATSSTQQVVVKDPDAEHRCYDVLGIAPSASPEDVKRAFKRRALKAHPDKEGGSQAAFLCLNLAYELLSDAKRRGTYDYELTQLRSQDGQAFKTEGDAADAPDAGLVEQNTGAPEMLCEAFCSFKERSWPPLIKLVTNENLCVLIRYLQSGSTEDGSKAEQSGTSAKKSSGTVPGLARLGRKYQGKIVFQGVCLRSFVTNLDDALDARMALGSAKQTVLDLIQEGKSFEDAFRSGVAQLREKEQNSCFHLLMAFEFATSTGANKKRLTTPQVPDVEQVLEQRGILLNLRETNAPEAEKIKAHSNMMAESASVRGRLKSDKMRMRGKLLEEARAELTRRGQELPPEGALPSGSAARSSRPAIEIKQFKVIGPNRVGILARPDATLTATNHMASGAIFDVSMVHISDGLKFFQLSDGSGWIPQCSRKDKTRIVVEQVDAEFDRPAIMDDEKGSDPEDSSSDSSSSSSSSSSSDS